LPKKESKATKAEREREGSQAKRKAAKGKEEKGKEQGKERKKSRRKGTLSRWP